MWKKYQVRLLKPLVRTVLFVAKEEIVDRKLPPPTLVITFTQSRTSNFLGLGVSRTSNFLNEWELYHSGDTFALQT